MPAKDDDAASRSRCPEKPCCSLSSEGSIEQFPADYKNRAVTKINSCVVERGKKVGLPSMDGKPTF